MRSTLVVVLLAALGAGSAWADLKPDVLDCNSKKAARNAAMDATVGVSGNCDAGKAAGNARDDVVEAAGDTVPDVSDVKPTPLDRDDKKGKLRKNKD
jgi:hypothetical protein